MENRRSVFTTIGASNHVPEQRQERDFYATDPAAIPPLLETLVRQGVKLPELVWEPCVGMGHISGALEKAGHKVWGTDIQNLTGKGDTMDFLNLPSGFERPNRPSWAIITNPPYYGKMAQEFVLEALSHLREGEVAAFFLKTTFLEGQSRREALFMNPETRPKFMFQFSKRMKCAKNGDFENTGGSAVAYAWFVWVKGSTTPTVLDWI